MESIYWVLAWACHRRCVHCYEERFRPYVRADLEAVIAEAARNVSAVVPNLPDRLDRIVLSGGEVLLDGVRQRVIYPAMTALRARYGAGLRMIVQTTGDLVTAPLVRELLDHGAWMISVAGIDDFHVGHAGEPAQRALRARLSALFEAAGMRASGHAAPLRAWHDETGPVYGFFGATPDMWIGKLWPRGRAWANGLSTATIADNFCAQWSGGRGFLDAAGSEVSIEPDGSVYPCCVKTRAAIGNVTEERLDDILDSLRGHPAFAAINAGAPEQMGEAFGWDVARFVAESRTVTPQGADYANLCIGCDRFHEAVLGPIVADIRARRVAAAKERLPC